MRRLRKTCLVTLLLASSSFQFGRFIAAQSPQTPRQRQDTSGAKAQAADSSSCLLKRSLPWTKEVHRHIPDRL
jgi:hypothetical protein